MNDTSALAFLHDALLRHLEEYPGTADGLGRSERALLRVVAEGARRPPEAFLADQQTEHRPFMGDATAWGRLFRLARTRHRSCAGPMAPGSARCGRPRANPTAPCWPRSWS